MPSYVALSTIFLCYYHLHDHMNFTCHDLLTVKLVFFEVPEFHDFCKSLWICEKLMCKPFLQHFRTISIGIINFLQIQC